MHPDQFVVELKKQIPVKKTVDVLVLGSGPAGISAAINASRCGVKTTLIEQDGMVGGVATTGLMSHWTGNTRGGFYEEVLERSTPFPFQNSRQTWTTIDHEELKLTFLEMLEEAGVDLQLYTQACAPILDGNCLTGVIIESKSGREASLAKIVIDATGDGDIAARAGVPFTKGRESDGSMQPMTLMFKIGGVDMDLAILPGSFESTVPVPAGEIQELGKNHLPPPAGHVLLYPSSLPGIVTVNMTNATGVDGTSGEDLTRAHIICQKQIKQIVAFLQKFTPGYEKCYLISSASRVGVRETRHFECGYKLTENDILGARLFDDWAVARVHFNFDIHNVKGSGLDDKGLQNGFPQSKGYTIPYRCFVPKHVDGLLLAGRNISGTHLAHSSFRVMPICANMGQTVGIAAALCVREDVIPRDLDVRLLQEKLRELGISPEWN